MAVRTAMPYTAEKFVHVLGYRVETIHVTHTRGCHDRVFPAVSCMRHAIFPSGCLQFDPAKDWVLSSHATKLLLFHIYLTKNIFPLVCLWIEFFLALSQPKKVFCLFSANHPNVSQTTVFPFSQLNQAVFSFLELKTCIFASLLLSYAVLA